MVKEASNEPLSYEDFEPYCKWKHETSFLKETYVLEIQLQGFKQEEVKIEIGRDGFLYITGEHPMGQSLKKRFKKKIDGSKYDIEKIDAKFEGSNVHLTLPIKRSAISFRNIGGGNGIVGMFHLGSNAFLNTIAVVLLLVLSFYMYKYSECTNFRNWFK
ncbi:uncharacterized protein LOC111294666 [Durio zibethinus]|uniref:Uncharacterized protein LOC111294666 n=1 Tax=Durio zibethinus TaxID=66656 RepID=A0A6P5YU52_DURZI|nr:uncharacterized protein LOC111294666 [Durio zibethinus]